MRLTRPEWMLALGGAAMVLLALGGPALAWPARHAFADARSWLGVPNAGDVLSNLAFAIAGCVGVWTLSRTPKDVIGAEARTMSALFFAGLLFTAAASSWYHWAPDDATLAVDRMGMAIAFAGVIGLAVATRVSARASGWTALALLVCATLAAQAASMGNVLPWAVVQFGGMAALLGIAALAPRKPGALPVRWGLLLVPYAAAKVLEMHDESVLHTTAGWVSGHSLKHIAAAAAAIPVIAALRHARLPRQNAPARRLPRTSAIASA